MVNKPFPMSSAGANSAGARPASELAPRPRGDPEPGSAEAAAVDRRAASREPGLHETVRLEPLLSGPLNLHLLLNRRPACRLVLGLRERQTDFASEVDNGQDTLALFRLNLRQEVPELRFWRQGDEGPEIVWLCAFESGAEELLERLRREHPQAFLMVSARDFDADTSQALEQLGADAVYRVDELVGPRLRERLLVGLANKRASQKRS
jgi:hypothetical protein